MQRLSQEALKRLGVTISWGFVMDKKTVRSEQRPSLTARLETVRYLAKIKSSSDVRRTVPFLQIAEGLVEAGYRSLDAQAKALGFIAARLGP